jgi:hypothetical protein
MDVFSPAVQQIAGVFRKNFKSDRFIRIGMYQFCSEFFNINITLFIGNFFSVYTGLVRRVTAGCAFVSSTHYRAVVIVLHKILSFRCLILFAKDR